MSAFRRCFPYAALFALMLCLAGCVREPGADLRTESALRGEAQFRLSQISGQLGVTGLRKPVTVLRDKWGVPHIYAENTEDLFFAQGFVAAQDRLYQIDIWRRTGRGELAEVFGEGYLDRDRMARLMRYRGNMDVEWQSYGPDARHIAESFVAGINACIDLQKDRLPIEFTLLDFKPGKWEPSDVLLRTAGLQMTYNVSNEIARARAINAVGLTEAMRWMPTEPSRVPEIPKGMNLKGLDDRVLALYRSVTGIPTLQAANGSNNWVVNGSRSVTGKPIMASDPHRALTLPSLRYLSHLVAPGWNMIGGGEPALPGLALGHNETFGFGFTIAAYDQVDLIVETVNEGKPVRYRKNGQWKPMVLERELVNVRGESAPVSVELKFTDNGPVIWEDPDSARVVAVRWAGAQPGTAGYLGSLALDRTKNAGELRESVKAWKIPPENLVYADTEGNIGWIAAGLVPIRNGYTGLLPVPGDRGSYTWNGFIPTEELPQELNPERGFIATANHNIVPPGYRYDLAFDWSVPYRIDRIREVLSEDRRFSVEDFEKLQQDEKSVAARELITILRSVSAPRNAEAARAYAALLAWDGVLGRDSSGAALYEIFFGKLRGRFVNEVVPEKLRDILRSRMDNRVLLRELLKLPAAARAGMVEQSLTQAWNGAVEKMGQDPASWKWGSLHTALFEHPLANTAARAGAFNIGPIARGGDAFTVNATGGNGMRQMSGASYRHILDFSNWDASVFTSTPGQSGQLGSPYYRNLADSWGEGKYAPLLYTREAIERNLGQRLDLVPR
ncbi:MAG: penicillin acylase family protein [Bryobacterales bacterium]|nr:penicillin acylase family protein [Bryobacterales bacterium]